MLEGKHEISIYYAKEDHMLLINEIEIPQTE